MSSHRRLPLPCIERFADKRWALALGIATLIAATTVVLQGVLAQPASAEYSAASDGSEQQMYRRVFVPADDPEAWPLEGRKYIPIDVRALNSLISAANVERCQSTSRAAFA
jgi:hypothetical protein